MEPAGENIIMEISNQLNWGWRNRLPLVHQTESAECGVACLAMIAGWYGYHVDLSGLRSRFAVTQHGMTFSRLIECAERLNLTGRAVRLELNELNQLALPCILYWDMNHFIVLKKVSGNHIELHDPAKGRLKMTLDKASRHFTGIALELSPAHHFERRDEKRKIRLQALIGKTYGLKAALGRIFCIALALEVLALIGPLLNQLVIDEVLVSLDADLLTVIISAMLLITAAQMLLGLARQWATITLAVNFNMQWAANIFHHLLRLPISWFETRNIGSISAKFNAVDAIQKTLTTSIVEALLDVLLVIGALSMMIIYNLKLTMIAVIAVFIYAVLRFIWFGTLKQAAQDSWSACTRESSHFLETLHGILSLRVNGALVQRESAWINLNVARRNTQLREGKLMMVYNIIQTVIASIVSAAVLWIGAGSVLSGHFSIGMLVAYMSFQARFSSSINSLIDKACAYRMLDVYSERLADIVLTQREGVSAASKDDPREDYGILHVNCGDLTQHATTKPILSIDNVSFSYGPDERAILSQVSLSVMPGEIVALVGHSGCGKTTLAKLILGLYSPTSGKICTLGVEHTRPHYVHVRQDIGSVLQEDKLFRGSIADNITLFSAEYDWEKVYESAQLAHISQDIECLPMGYQTVIGELGGTLSGGQKQRLLLARALYKKPKLLLLDEATSHLDTANEAIISQTLRQLGLPVLLIAHRPETIASADRVIELVSGKIVVRR